MPAQIALDSPRSTPLVARARDGIESGRKPALLVARCFRFAPNTNRATGVAEYCVWSLSGVLATVTQQPDFRGEQERQSVPTTGLARGRGAGACFTGPLTGSQPTWTVIVPFIVEEPLPLGSDGVYEPPPDTSRVTVSWRSGTVSEKSGGSAANTGGQAEFVGSIEA